MEVAVPPAVVIVAPAEKEVVPEGANQTLLEAVPEETIVTVAPPILVTEAAKTVSWLVGAVRSKFTADASVVEVTAVPAFPAMSEKEILKVTVPSVSPMSIVCVADQAVGPPVTDAEAPAMVTVGVWIDSFEVKVKVTTSPVLACVVVALLEAMWTGERVGAVLSTVRIAVDWVEIFPAASKTNRR